MQQRFDVQGMTCDHCVRAVTDAVRALDANARIDIDLTAGRVEVESDAERARIAQAIRSEGYTVAG